MTRPIITFTTDFGPASPYIAEMKGVALTLRRNAHLIDITHEIPPQNIRAGAWVLAQVAPSFPPNAIHVGVVDPGVGTNRTILVARNRLGVFVAPNNGLLSRVAAANPFEELVEAHEPRFWREQVSATFHGRDIMTPLAAHVAGGVPLSELGPACEHMAEFDWSEPRVNGETVEGAVVAVDSFGNLITNISQEHLGASPQWRIRCGNACVEQLSHTYADSPDGSFVALMGSSGWLEVAIVGGNAAARLNIAPGEPVVAENGVYFRGAEHR